jgi:ribosomal protein S18 acetylase RimI-like enzyme
MSAADTSDDQREPGAWTIRCASETNIAAVLALWRQTGGPASATDDEEALRTLLEHDQDALLIAEASNELIGSLIAGWDGWRGSFYRLAVDSDRRRQGIATALVRAGEERLRGLGARRLTAIVRSDEDDAIALWSAVGYTQQTERTRFIRMLEESC